MKIRLSAFGEDFLKLALRIDKHNKGYVDFYIGPEYIRKKVEDESLLSPIKLLNDSQTLLSKLWKQGYEKDREKYIFKQLIAMRTSIEILLGYEIPFKKLILRLHDVELKPISDSELYDMKEDFDKANEGPGTLGERMKELRIRRTIPGKHVYKLFNKALKLVRNKTYELFYNILPDEELVTLVLVEQKEKELKWSYYNKYIGNNHSIIEINPNYNMYWTSFLYGSSHEGYPGHHTEFILKESLLYRKKSQFEHSILLLNSPKLIISEGIAELALNVLYNYQEQAEIGLNEFCMDKSKEDSIVKLANQNWVRRRVNYINFNLGYYAHVEKWSKEKLFRYANAFEIFSEENIHNQIKIANDPILSTATFSYYLGNQLIMDKYGEFPSVNDFTKLLTNPILPSDLIS
jgi:hypothetical protein